MLGYVCASWLLRAVAPGAWLPGCLVISHLFLFVLHGSQAAWPWLLAAGSHFLTRGVAGKKHAAIVIWATHVAVFLLVRQHNGLHIGWLISSMAWVDRHGGLLRWHIHYNLLLLRMLSAAMDTHWTLLAQRKGLLPTLAPHDRTSSSHGGWKEVGEPAGLPHYLLYCFYPPLYVAGPTMTYNSFTAQIKAGAGLQPRQVTLYALRWLAAAALLDGFTRVLYVNAIAKYRLLPSGLLAASPGLPITPLHYALVGFWVLVFMWLKFLVIWRFFRLAALADGLDPPENMLRCVCNNYDVQGFWQGWHASYNRWLVRYLYVPLGGAAWRAANVWPIFLFVALWHDLELRLLAWGLVMPAAFLPEMAVKAFSGSAVLRPYRETWGYRQAAAAAGAANIVILMAANLVGFVVGPAGLLPFLRQALGQPRTGAAVFVALFCAVQLMFAIREREGWGRPAGAGGPARLCLSDAPSRNSSSSGKLHAP